ncbi:crotonase/enoyl-CoA hydratase family protein [Pseudofrankia inefficax]|uniref:Enoyl-CoA hydratase/isomerase n=1 Tax=Pseudofrankia inefficax (strain DSM 45817 / CECT 9037 / DDB 130130 / EuI1c) TaxID=298654 RepID=E3IU59_PSEI1|nr:crotonase/enoyl-CoA hydratase family protein [Pseudofrankia inefficax]ADP81252.1 Enoyl-CoA hydratase/isomerase [Pseudofrankia inefficax]
MADDVLVSRVGAVQVITINRPEARNALDLSVATKICAAVDELDETDELRAGVLTGAGGTFCSGMDLKAFLRGERPVIEGRGLCGITQTRPRKPMVAAVEGWALAGGFELALACDLVVASTAARFGVPEVKRGLVASGGGALTLASRIAPAVALELLLTGEPVDAARAFDVGLVNRLAEPGEALQTAVELATTIAGNGPLAVAASKLLATDGTQWRADERWRRQSEIVAPVAASEDAREGARAFAERRAPVWRGR